MTGIPAADMLLAQVSREDFGRGFRGATSQLSWTDLIPYVAAAILATIGISLYRWIKRRNDMTESCDDPSKLFRELCGVHKLDRPSRRMLWRLSEAWGLAQPAQIFLTPNAFDADRLPPALRKQAAELQRLRERLF
jgi:hypothetical protein